MNSTMRMGLPQHVHLESESFPFRSPFHSTRTALLPGREVAAILLY